MYISLLQVSPESEGVHSGLFPHHCVEEEGVPRLRMAHNTLSHCMYSWLQVSGEWGCTLQSDVISQYELRITSLASQPLPFALLARETKLLPSLHYAWIITRLRLPESFGSGQFTADSHAHKHTRIHTNTHIIQSMVSAVTARWPSTVSAAGTKN